MNKRIVKLARDPFHVDLVDRPARLLVDSATGDVLMDCAVLHAQKGLAFALATASIGKTLRLQSVDFTIDIGWTDDPENAASWVEAANALLATKRGAAAPNGQVAPQAPAGSAVG